jgi:hypothetical protein
LAPFHADSATFRRYAYSMMRSMVGIQEDLTPIRQLDFRYPRVVVHDPTELVELEEAGTDLRLDQPLGGRTARTCELADGGRLEPDPVLVTGPEPADPVAPHEIRRAFAVGTHMRARDRYKSHRCGPVVSRTTTLANGSKARQVADETAKQRALTP